MPVQSSITDFFGTPSSSTPRSPTLRNATNKPQSKLKGLRVLDDPRQTIIDAGQKKIGLEYCSKCEMSYNISVPRDKQAHDEYCNRFTQTKHFHVTANQLQAWRKSVFFEDVLDGVISGTLFHLNEKSTSTLKKKVEQIITEFVNVELGCRDMPVWSDSGSRQAFVFITKNTGKDPAFVAALTLVDVVDTVKLMPRGLAFCGEFLGVNRIWVHTRMRRKGLATFLLDAVRRLAASGPPLPKTRVAFSDPDETGVQLAKAYLNDKENGRYITYSLV
ncbi:N-acetyltransferase ESCO1 [Aphelenchoides avenae]|nr:N-acetyltransferase ESCO1 [Aphelenchus avenae]